jgi:hypothetical protein
MRAQPLVGEAFVSDQQPAADAVERVALAAPVAEGVLLDLAADLVERGVGQADGVEVINHQSPSSPRSRGWLDGAPARVVHPFPLPQLGATPQPNGKSQFPG